MKFIKNYLEAAVNEGIPSLSLAVANKDGIVCAYTAGMADIGLDLPAAEDHLFGIGSITKTFVAVIILQLVEEGHLSLESTPLEILGDDRIGFVSGVGTANVAQLLNHTSGIPSWEDDPDWIRQGRGKDLDVTRLWAPEDTLSFLKGSELLHQPGQAYAYANTNYTLLGLIIEKITGRTIVEELRDRILKIVGIEDIYLEGFQHVPRERLANRYHYATLEFERDAGIHSSFTPVTKEPQHSNPLIDVSPSNLSVEWAAGGLLASARDLALFAAALRAGKLLKPESLAKMQDWFRFNEMQQVGHGLFRLKGSSGHGLCGHLGSVLGYTGAMHWFEEVDLAVVVLANVGNMHIGQDLPSAVSVALNTSFIRKLMACAKGKV
ncbi:beta-lactamase family protein [bacterium]|nr:beta-lactamase family protein [bacterium]